MQIYDYKYIQYKVFILYYDIPHIAAATIQLSSQIAYFNKDEYGQL